MSKDNRLRDELVQQVQFNCHLSDAHHARDYSLCIYLLKMREFYRWEQGLDFGERLPKEALGEWLTEREQLWEGMEEKGYQPIAIDNRSIPPYEADSVNQAIVAEGYVYSGGYCGPKPHFFLAELERVEQVGETTIYLSGHELARELTAPPAMSLGNRVFLRRESLQRMIWEKLEEWGWQEPDRAIARAAASYDLQRHLHSSLNAMADDEIDTLLEHELGEIEIGNELGNDWEAMLSALPRSHAEFWLRAVRDHLVDCTRTLPWLLEEGRTASLHFYFANFTTMRKSIFPELQQAYDKWIAGDNGNALREAVKRGAERWFTQAQAALSIYREVGGEDERSLRLRLNRLSQS